MNDSDRGGGACFKQQQIKRKGRCANRKDISPATAHTNACTLVLSHTHTSTRMRVCTHTTHMRMHTGLERHMYTWACTHTSGILKDTRRQNTQTHTLANLNSLSLKKQLNVDDSSPVYVDSMPFYMALCYFTCFFPILMFPRIKKYVY